MNPAQITKLAIDSKKSASQLADEILEIKKVPADAIVKVAKIELINAIKHYRKKCSKCTGEKSCNNPYLIQIEIFQKWIFTKYYPCKTKLKGK